jgi:restriction system protein
MALPKYDELYGNVMCALKEGGEKSRRELREVVAKQIGLSAAEQEEQLPSGASVWSSRVGWAVTYLTAAGLLARVRRGVYVLSDEGKRVLASGERVDNALLARYPAFRAFCKSAKTEEEALPHPQTERESPQEALDSAYQLLRRSLAEELLDEVCRQDSDFFERMVVQLMLRMGYGGGEESGFVTPRSGDEGVDGWIQEDKLGFSSIGIQAKKWDKAATVSRPEVQKFVGALAGKGVQKGLFITTAQFTAGAQEYARQQHSVRIALVDGMKLAYLMMEHGLGVTTERTYAIRRIDSDFFAEED